MMKNNFFNFLKKLIYFSLITGGVAFLAARFFVPDKYLTPVLPYLFLFFFAITSGVYYFILKSFEKKFSRFISLFMLGTVVKLLLYFVVLVIYVFKYRYDAVNFIVSFFILYVLYTVFEIFSVLPYTGAKKE